MFILLLSITIFAQNAGTTKQWVGTWACAPYEAGTNTPPTPLANNTLRQIVRVSIGGDTLRLKFSNRTGTSAITLQSVNIAVSPDGTKGAVTASTMKELKFNGNQNITINAGAEAYSDPIAFNLTPNMRLAITTYYGQCQSNAQMTHHYGSRTDSYILTGDKTTSADFGGATVTERWFTISSIDVLAPKTALAVAVIGNSITDGYGLHGGLQNKWTDRFSEALLKNPGTEQVAVLNLGIGATLVTAAGNGAKSGVDRFKPDVLGQSGVHWVIIFYGINDIGGGVAATPIIDGFKKMLADCRAKDTSIKVYGATITPVNGNSYYSAAHESVRSAVNKWIRTPGNLDGFIDFDKSIRNPSDTTRLQAAYSNDWLHPSAEGYKVLGESIDLKLFTPPPVATKKATAAQSTSLVTRMQIVNGTATMTFNLEKTGEVSVKIYTLSGTVVASAGKQHCLAGKQTIRLSGKGLSKGMYLYSLRSDFVSRCGSVAFTGRD